MKKFKQYGMLINLHKCTGCYACQVTCKAEYSLPLGSFRCKVETHKSDSYPEIKKFFLPRLCNQCADAPCIRACKDDALFRNNDGVVELRENNCIGCGLCRDACPYNAIDINPDTGKSEKCDFCYQRITKGLLPVCVQSCMGKAMIFGDIHDRESEIHAELVKNKLKVLRPEWNTKPNLFYLHSGSAENTPLGDYQLPALEASKKIPGKASILFSDTKLIHTSDVMCPSECGISVLVENGIAKKIYGNPHSLINNGAFCAKGAAGLQLTYSPHRIKTPLMRIGARGEDKWKEITWDEACDYIAKKLITIKKEFGPETVFFDGGDVTDREAYYRLFHAFGTPHTYNHGSICDPNRKWGQKIMLGDERPLPDLQRPMLIRDESGALHLNKKHNAKLIMHIGVNSFVATRFNYMSYGITGARQENKCIFIVADPAHTNSAALSDMWLPIRPGTDAHLLAGMLYCIIMDDSPDRKYIDHDFIDKYTVGWPEFKDSFLSYTERDDPSNGLKYFSPEWTEEKTGLSKEKIREVSRLFGATKPAAIEIGMHGTAHHTNGDVASILMTALCLVTGNMDTPGGLVFIDSQKVKKGIETSGAQFLERLLTKNIGGNAVTGKLSELHKDFYGYYPAAFKGVLSDMPRRIREGITLKHGVFKGYHYPVKALFVRAGNPVITGGSISDWIEALTSHSPSPSPPPLKGGGNFRIPSPAEEEELKEQVPSEEEELKEQVPSPLSEGLSSLLPSPLAGEGKGEGCSGIFPEYKLELFVFIDTHISVTGKYADIILPEAGFLERMGLSDVYTMSPEVAIRDKVIKPLHESKTPYEIMTAISDALIKNGDTDIKAEDFSKRYRDEEDFINELLSDSPGFYNIGEPLPFPDLPQGCLIIGAPDNPSAIWGKTVIKKGEPLTVQWLRQNNGVAVWPGSYHRYKKADGSPSGIYPKTRSKKFEFRFSFLEELNKKFGANFPVTFYWSESMWNPKNPSYKEISRDYPFQLISGRVHHAMTMTQVCSYLTETETECMKPMNEAFDGFKADTMSIPVLAINTADGDRLGIKTGEIITLENPLKKTVRGKAYLTDEIMPGVIKTAFGPGGQKASGIGFMNNTADYTASINSLFDPENLSPFSGMAGFGDIMVRVIKGSD
ncbi:MAG: molybdopterin-dependent oxidoreductase [Nitrospirae bacterium]|nr:molybdopterin-dependent oxidoreductase [Nitrospirota bacterium]